MKTKHRVEVFAGRTLYDGHPEGYYWRIRHSNGRKLATSEGYTRHSTALRIARNVAKAGGFEIVDLTKKRKA